MMSLSDTVVAYEQGELDAHAQVRLFAALVRNGWAWTLQGHYGRTAVWMIENGYLDVAGNVLREPNEED